MNNFLLYTLVLTVTATNMFMIRAVDNFTIIVKPKWYDLDHGNDYKSKQFGGKWVLVGSITFKKRCKDPMNINALSLHWNGKKIDNLIASLYRKNNSKDFLPIDKNLICDGVWNKNKQSVLFNFECKETLSPTTTFYLVLTLPQDIETTLTNGTFSLEEHYLPKPFRHCAHSAQFSLNGISNVSPRL